MEAVRIAALNAPCGAIEILPFVLVNVHFNWLSLFRLGVHINIVETNVQNWIAQSAHCIQTGCGGTLWITMKMLNCYNFHAQHGSLCSVAIARRPTCLFVIDQFLYNPSKWLIIVAPICTRNALSSYPPMIAIDKANSHSNWCEIFFVFHLGVSMMFFFMLMPRWWFLFSCRRKYANRLCKIWVSWPTVKTCCL